MAEGSASVKKPLQQGVEDSLLGHYYDIMVIGKTGSGKTTTAEKLLIAYLPRQEQPTQQQPAVGETGKNFCMWVGSDKNEMSRRLKHLNVCSSHPDPHKQVNSAHEKADHESTTDCELLSNELTRVRVLDVPGFFGVTPEENVSDLTSYIHQGTKADLGIVRKILRIKSAHNLKFNRIVYFLPMRGPLINADRILTTELGIMKKYFGRPIFESMVVVAALSSDVYDLIEDKGQDLFPKLQQTSRHFKEALNNLKAFNPEDIPEPPIIFISLFDTCENILEKIQNAKVMQDSLNLELQRYLCARCDVHIISEGATGADVFSCALPEQGGPISGEESTCHPMMIPKYSKVKKIFGGIAHLITFRRFVGKWPNFENMDEVCISCKGPPKTRGCMRVGEEFKCDEESFTVAHSASALERYKFEIEVQDDDEDDQAEGLHQEEPIQGPPSECQRILNVSQDEREVNRQERGAGYAPGDMKG